MAQGGWWLRLRWAVVAGLLLYPSGLLAQAITGQAMIQKYTGIARNFLQTRFLPPVAWPQKPVIQKWGKEIWVFFTADGRPVPEEVEPGGPPRLLELDDEGNILPPRQYAIPYEELGKVVIDEAAHRVIRFEAPAFTDELPQDVLSPEEAEKMAENFLRQHCPELWTTGDEVACLSVPAIHPEQGTYAFWFAGLAQGRRLPLSAQCAIRAFQPEVAVYRRSEEALEHPLSWSSAQSRGGMAMECYTQGRETVKDFWQTFPLVHREVDPSEGLILAWRLWGDFGRPAPWDTTVRRGAEAHMDAFDGHVFDVRLAFLHTIVQPLPNRSDSALWRLMTVYPNDRWPSWSPDGQSLVFHSDRPRPGYPPWRGSLHPTLFRCEVESGRLSCLVQALEGRYLFPDWSRDGRQIAFESDRIGTLNLETGEPGYHTTAERPGGSPAWVDGGRHLAISAERRHGDRDIFVVDTPHSLESSDGQWRVAKTEGEDILPVMNPRHDYLLYAHSDPSQEGAEAGAGWSLYKVPPARPYWENVPPEKVLEGLPRPRRLGWFPDGERVLLESENGLEMVNSAPGQCGHWATGRRGRGNWETRKPGSMAPVPKDPIA